MARDRIWGNFGTGGTLTSFDASAIEKRKGIKKVMRVGDTAVAVVADTWWRANSALKALPVVWNKGPNAKVFSATLAAFIKTGLDAPEALVGTSKGDAKAVIAASERKFERVYFYPFQNHATMEPMNTTVLWTSERCEA